MDTKINQVRSGSGVTVVVINGFLSESNADITDWLDLINCTHPNAKIMHLDWPASNVQKQLMAFVAASLARSSLNILAPIGAIANLYSGGKFISIASTWAESIKNTEAAGQFLAQHINASDDEFIIMGHSLGARVAYHTLRNLSSATQVNNVYLFGGAVGIDAEWERICQNNKALKIANLFSHNDSVLKYLYKAGTLFKSEPVGRNQIIVPSKNQINNVDTSHIVAGHMEYKKKELGGYMTII